MRLGAAPWAPSRRDGGGARFSFASGMQLERPTPPAVPPATKGFGSVCWKATCIVYTKDDGIEDRYGAMGQTHGIMGCPVARATGYGYGPEVAAKTQAACERYVASNFPRRDVKCDAAVLAMLPPPASPAACEGLFFEVGGTTKMI